MKMSVVSRSLFLFTLGILVALAASFFYWQTNKQSLAKKILGSSYQSDSCLRDFGDSIDEKATEEKEIYFVGCGGFF